MKDRYLTVYLPIVQSRLHKWRFAGQVIPDLEHEVAVLAQNLYLRELEEGSPRCKTAIRRYIDVSVARRYLHAKREPLAVPFDDLKDAPNPAREAVQDIAGVIASVPEGAGWRTVQREAERRGIRIGCHTARNVARYLRSYAR